mmetsp:Transcript_16086/g.36934  ORF Transcript_16086/g.36934 Transcript_16086/m.36934 type:complete len:334 (+) Transcript_16086:493-1494(+)
MRLCDILNCVKLSCLLSLGCEDLHPGQDSPHSIFLSDMVCSCAKRLFATDEWRVCLLVRVVVRATVHEVAKELPSCWHLEALNLLLLCDQIQGTRCWHGSRATLQAILELRDEVTVRHQHGYRVRWRHEELRTHDHVPVRITICRGAEGRWRRCCLNLVGVLVQAHRLHELDCVCEVGICMAVPCRLGPTEIFPGIRVGSRPWFGTKLLLHDLPCVWALDTRHAVIDHGEVRSCNHHLDLFEIEALLQQSQMVLHAIKHFHRLVAHLVRGCLGQVNVWDLVAYLVLCDLGGPINHLVCHLFWSWTAILTVVLDTEIFILTTRVVGRRANEATE